MPVPWNEDAPGDLRVIQANLRNILQQIIKEAPHRSSPTVEMAKDWHRQIYRGIQLPVPYYAGEVRDSDPQFPQLIGYEVIIGTSLGVESRFVPEELSRFESAVQRAVSNLDPVIPEGQPPEDSKQLRSVLTLCAHAHGEWVRIHPFANGNGRTARLWANWCAVRYGLPPFVRLKPRPEGNGYAIAAKISMRGNHRPMVAEFTMMLERRLQSRPH